MKELSFAEDLCNDILAGGQAYFITATGPDEVYAQADIQRAVLDIAKYSRKPHKPLATITWDLLGGFRELVAPGGKTRLSQPWREEWNKKTDPIEALKTLLLGVEGPWKKENAVFIFRDMQPFFNIPAVARAIRNGVNQRSFNISTDAYRRPIVCLAPSATKLEDSLKTSFRFIPYPLPRENELRAVLLDIETRLAAAKQAAPITDEDLRDRLITATLGLTQSNAENIIAFAIRITKEWTEETVEIIEDRKAQELQKSEILVYTPKYKLSNMANVGGCDLLKTWLEPWKRAFSKKARELNLPYPKGMVLAGPPGTGKSLIGSVVAADLGMAMFELNYANAFDKYVGETENRVSRSLEVIDAMGACVVFIDEAEKALAGSSGGQATSNDVSQKAFGILNKWMTKPSRKAFVICAMNRTQGVPAEFLRRGRFDEIFLVNRPAGEDRKEIAEIVLRRQSASCKLTRADWDEFIEQTREYTGAEIEAVITTARYNAFMTRGTGDPNLDELLAAVKTVTPQARSASAISVEEMIAALQDAKQVSSRTDTISHSQSGRAVQL